MSPSRAGLVCLLVLVSCKPLAPPPPATTSPILDPAAFDGQRALSEVRDFIATGPRVAGTDGAARGAAAIASRLTELGLANETDVFEEQTPHGLVVFRNVLGTIPGHGKGQVIIASHYDTKAGISDDFVGANDSGSSTGLLLALAASLKQSRYGPDILLAFLDGEECRASYGPRDGLHGSRHLAASLTPEAVRAVIVVDMIGDSDLHVTIPRNSNPMLIAMAFEAAEAAGVRNRFSLYRGAILDDHVPFLDLGMPAIDLIDFNFGSAPGKNDYWHTDQDTLDKLSAKSLASIGRVVIHMLNALNESPK